jgi:RNA polymerase sigma factor (sigma-70 family)
MVGITETRLCKSLCSEILGQAAFDRRYSLRGDNAMPSPKDRSTDTLIKRARQGISSAVNRLLESTRPDLRRKARAGRPRSLDRKLDLSDYVQEAQFLAAAHLVEFEGRTRGEFRAWIGKILDRVILQKQRLFSRKKRDRRLEVPLARDGGVPDGLAGSTTSVLGQLVREEEIAHLKEIMDWCRQEDLEVISQRLFEDRSYKEIAAASGVNCADVRKRYSRAIHRLGQAGRLRELMTRHGFPADQQRAIGLHRFQGASAARIADLLQLPERRVDLWLAEAKPLIRELSEE